MVRVYFCLIYFLKIRFYILFFFIIIVNIRCSGMPKDAPGCSMLLDLSPASLFISVSTNAFHSTNLLC